MRWFKHDSDASNDAKLRKLRLKYGAQGYGVYWYCLELIARNVDKHNLTFELEHDAELIADDFKLSSELVQEMMFFMVKLGLFENESGVITCLKMLTRTDDYTQKLIATNKKCSDKLPTVSGQTPRKFGLREEKRREEKRDGRSFSPPTHEEVKAYCKERRNNVKPDAFMAFYESNGWRVGKNKMKDWKAAIRTWESRDDSTNAKDFLKGAI